MEESVTQRHTGRVGIRWYRDWLLLLIVLVVLAVDQVSKYVVRAFLAPWQSFPREGIARILHTQNTGGIFGLFPDQTLFLIVASILAIGVLLLVYRRYPFSGPLLRLSLGLQLGGAVGNLVDRLRLGYVTDFVQLGWWPVFNMADASTTLGIALLVTLILWPAVKPAFAKVERRQRVPTGPQPAEEEPARTSDEPPPVDR